MKRSITIPATQLTFEQHVFELLGSIICRVFSMVNTTALQDPRLVGSQDAEPWIQRADYKVIMQIFDHTEGLRP